MIRLGMREPVWLELAEGVRVRVRPITTPAYAMIQARAEQVYEDWAEHKAGTEGLDPQDPSVRRGLMRALMIKGLALYAIIEWEGIEAEACPREPAGVTDAAIAAFVDEHPLLAALFYYRYLSPLEERAAEGNASGPAPHGTSAAGPDTAGPAPDNDPGAAGKAVSPAAAAVPTAPTSP